MIDRDVELKVGEKVYMLSPTLDAMRKINRTLGSPIEALNRSRQFDLDALCVIVSAGAGLSQKQADKLPAEIFNAGVVNVAPQVAAYLAVLMDPTGDGEEAEPGKP